MNRILGDGLGASLGRRACGIDWNEPIFGTPAQTCLSGRPKRAITGFEQGRNRMRRQTCGYAEAAKAMAIETE